MKLTLEDGQQVEISMSFRKLAMLRTRNKDAYNRYNSITINGAKELIDYLSVIYTAYCCNCENPMSFTEFEDLFPYDHNFLIETFNNIVAPKKKPESQSSSEAKQEG